MFADSFPDYLHTTFNQVKNSIENENELMRQRYHYIKGYFQQNQNKLISFNHTRVQSQKKTEFSFKILNFRLL